MSLIPDVRAQECYERAARARQLAKECTDPLDQADYNASAERWLELGERCQLASGLAEFLRAPARSLHPRCVVCAVPMPLARTEHSPGRPSWDYSHYECKVCRGEFVLPEVAEKQDYPAVNQRHAKAA
jgi:hypothetical protein